MSANGEEMRTPPRRSSGTHGPEAGTLSHNRSVDQQTSVAWRIVDNVAWIDDADFGMAEQLYVTLVPDGLTVLLEGTARLIWLVAVDGGSIADRVAELVGLPHAAIAEDVARFLTETRRVTRPGGQVIVATSLTIGLPSSTTPPALPSMYVFEYN